MLVIINHKAAAGNAIKKWEVFSKQFDWCNDIPIVKQVRNIQDYDSIINEYINSGEKTFAAAGGDGTVNLLMNKLIERTGSEIFTLAAVGIGSSNDFHKPFNNILFNIPYKLDYKNAEYWDIGSIHTNLEHKYFIINSSIGITADANAYFNSNKKIINLLKRISCKIAILYAAIRTILRFKPIFIDITIDGRKFSNIKAANIGIVKNTHFSGDFSYSENFDYTDGMFQVYIIEYSNKFNLINTLKKLSKPNQKLIKGIKGKDIEIVSNSDFNIEYDGEIIKSNQVKFQIIQNKIKVCR